MGERVGEEREGGREEWEKGRGWSGGEGRRGERGGEGGVGERERVEWGRG